VKAITLIENALADFERRSGLSPRVVLLPRRVFEQYYQESKILESALPELPAPKDSQDWTDVRVVEHGFIEELEVY